MKFTTSRESLLRLLQSVIGVVERRQTMAILANVLVVAKDGALSVTATDLEVELVAQASIDGIEVPGSVTVPGRKLLDICRALNNEATIKLSLDEERLTIKSGRSRFVLSTLPAADFPVVEDVDASRQLTLSDEDLHLLLDKTHFCMAQQDVRYYLNGLLFETDGAQIRTVATDGHRLALSEMAMDGKQGSTQQVILPRKGVLELQRLIGAGGKTQISIGSNHIRALLGDIRFTSKLIDGRFPDYQKVIPQLEGNILKADCAALRQALQRAAILSNEKYRGIRLNLNENRLGIQANNPDQEEAQDEVEVKYTGDAIEIGFNVNYLLDALAAVESEEVEIGFVDPNSSCLIRQPGTTTPIYVVMPMRL